MMALCAALACLVVYFTWSILHSVVWFLPSVLYWLFSITYTVLRCGDKYECTVPGQLQSESVCFENTVSMEAYIEEYRHNLHRIVHVSAYHLQLPNAPTCVERYGFFYG